MRNNLRLRMKRVMGAALLLLSVGIVSANTLSLESNNDGTWNVNFSSDADIGEFQFNIDGVIVNGASGGEAATNGFFMSNSPTTVLGFSLSGSTIPAGSGTLVVVNVTGTPSGLSGIIMSDAIGYQLDFTYLPSEGDGPADFAFNQSTLQAGYFFVEVTLNGSPIESDDWVGAFNGDMCVGARQWDTSGCNNGVCEVIAMGNDGSDNTAGYCNSGDIPNFKIYDASENIYYDAIPSENASWSVSGFNLIDELNAFSSVQGCMDDSACNYSPDATEDDGSCVFPEENYDCDGNCLIEEDCAGECGGSAVIDECGICEGDGIPAGECDCNGNVDLDCGCDEPAPSGCDNVCGSTAEVDECGECGGDGSTCGGENPPDWEDNPGAYEFTATISGGIVLNTNGDQMGECDNIDSNGLCIDEIQDMFAAFDDDENVRGVGIMLFPPFGPHQGTPVYEMQMRSNSEGDLLHFKYYDASEDAILDIIETYEFIINDILGDMINPVFYNIGSGNPPCEDDDSLVAPFTCATAVASFGCEFLWGGVPLSELCPVSCDACPVYGCQDSAGCNYNPDATEDDGSCVFPEENYDCDGNCLIEEDCAGECGGTAIVDACGVCGGDNSSCADCAGTPNGDSWESDCGCVESDNSGDDCDDCAGVPNGDSWESDCGCVESDNSGDDCDDCAGVPNGDSWESDCGCVESDNSGDDCDDCAGVPNGDSEVDNCGTCDNDPSNDCIQDCAGEWGGSLEDDECGICGGGGADVMCEDGSYVCEANDCPDELDECMDDPNTCIWNNVYNNYDNQEDCEENGGIWGGYLEYFNTSCEEMVNLENGCGIQILYWTVSALCPASCGVCCDDEDACNHDGEGSCEYAEENYDCDGNYCTAGEDCAGECGGSAVIDECGICEGIGIPAGECDCDGNVDLGCGCDEPAPSGCDNVCGSTAEVDECGECGGDGLEEGFNCDGSPELFNYNNSILQAFYYFTSVTINGENVESADWVGAFNGDICVGARKWDTSLCNSGVCDVPVMGQDGWEETEGYMLPGDFPTFKIYDASAGEYYDAVASEEYTWVNMGFNNIDNLNGVIFGCTDPISCNYIAEATMDDGSCLEFDCTGDCGGSAVLDECGVCNGNGAEDGFSCGGIPLEFVFNQSSLQAFYYIDEASDLAGNPLTAEDWVGAFNGDICVGSRQWDTSLCNNGICDVPAMGDDGFDYSEGYLLPGDLPSFKIYDYSEGDYFDAYPSENYPYENTGLFNIDELVLDLSYSIPLTQYNNLMSFYVLPEDILVSNVMLDIQENIVAISGEATSAQYFIEGDYWTGTLMNLDISSGYWMRVAEEDTLDGSGHSYDPGRVYNLHSGANLVSFPSIGNVGISAGLPDEIEANVLAILGEGMSTVNSDEGWEGSLLDFKALHGYWIITDEEISFSYNLDSLEPLSRKVNPYLVSEIPHGFDYIQSTQQAFYYVEEIKLINGEIENGDWLFSYCGNTVTGARQWLGKKVDIPAMGTEGDMMTAGYCGVNDTPHFKLLKSNSQKLIALHAETPKWQPNGIFFLGSLEEAAPLPNEFVMFAAYPNPFNPITQMRYEIPAEGNLEISIFDLRGQKVETLVNKFIQPGEYTANWDASHVASGVYFVHFTALGEGRPPISQIQKLMLVK